jgi:hypothetical protein
MQQLRFAMGQLHFETTLQPKLHHRGQLPGNQLNADFAFDL